MTAKEQIKKLRQVEARLRYELKETKEKLSKVEQDRANFRKAFKNNLYCSIEVLGKGETWNMQYVVKTLSEQMTKFEKWWW